jgi:hypothetical protein
MTRIILSVLTLLCFALPAAAEDDDEVAAQLAAMQAHMTQLEQKLVAATDQLAAAEQRIAAQEALAPTEAVDASSGLAPFLDTIDVSGFVSATYFWNFNDPDGSDQFGANAPVDLLHPDANSFSLDQLWLTISRDVSPEQRAGFKAEFVYGKTASILSGDNVDGSAGNDFDLYQGYVTYLAPLGAGVTIQAGKFATLIGAEVASSRDNWNVTRGNVYNYLQPINHTGVIASTPIGPVTATFGVVDETRAFPATNADPNHNKALLFGASAAGETFAGSFAGTYGRSPFGSSADDKELILDFIFRMTPSEKIAAYVNADYVSFEDSASTDVDGYGIAAAARFALGERAGIAGRLEYLSLDPDSGGALSIFGITGTLDYALTDALTMRGELRYDDATDGGPIYVGDGGLEGDQVTAGLELLYGF